MTRWRTPSSKWTGPCKFSFYLGYAALQYIPVLLFKRVSTSTSLCACLGYEHHYTFVYLGLQYKWNQPRSNNSCHTNCIHKGLHAGKWPDPMTSKPDALITLGYHWNHTGWCYRPVAFQWQSSVNMHNWNTPEDHWSHKYIGMLLEPPHWLMLAHSGIPVAIQS